MMVEITGHGHLCRYTTPFCFIKPQIEFCLGYQWNSDNQCHRFWISTMDETPLYIETNNRTFHWISLAPSNPQKND